MEQKVLPIKDSNVLHQVQTCLWEDFKAGPLANEGYTLSQNNIRLVIKHAKKYNMKPSFLIAQMFVESHWGDPDTSTVGSVDNNWSGISDPFNVPEDLNINMRRGTARPSAEGGYYVHFETLEDFFKGYTFLLSNRNGFYKVEGTTNIEDYCKGLFRVGGAASDYAASGYQHYYDLLIPTYNALEDQNVGKLEEIDNSTASDDGNDGSDIDNPGTNEPFERINEIGSFYPNTTVNVRDYPSTKGNIVAQYVDGEMVNYDSYVINDGYIWLSYISFSGPRRYIAWRVQDGETFGSFDSELDEAIERIPETGTFYPNTTINVRDYPSTSGNILTQYTSEDSLIYDSYVVSNGYVWLSYIASSGARRYVAWRVQDGETFGTIV